MVRSGKQLAYPTGQIRLHIRDHPLLGRCLEGRSSWVEVAGVAVEQIVEYRLAATSVDPEVVVHVELLRHRTCLNLMDEEASVIVFQEERIRMVGREEVVDAVRHYVGWHVLAIDSELALRDELLQEVGISPLVGSCHVIAHNELLALSPLVEAVVQIHLTDLGEVLAVDPAE